jgi:hypothetical protein
VEVVVVVAGSFQQVNPIKASQEQPEPHKVLLDKAKAAVMEQVAVAVAVVKTAALEDQYVAETTVHSAVKMATVWHPVVVLYLVVRMVAVEA